MTVSSSSSAGSSRSLPSFLAFVALGALAGWGFHAGWKRLLPEWTSRVVFTVNPNAFDGTVDAARIELEAATAARCLVADDLLQSALQRPEVLSKTAWMSRYAASASEASTQKEMLYALSKAVHAAPIAGTRLFELQCVMATPEDARIVADAIAKSFRYGVQMTADMRLASELKELENRRQQLDDAMLQKKQQLQDFIRSAGLTGLTGADADMRQTLERMRMDVSAASVELLEAQMIRSDIERRLQDPSGDTGVDKDALRAATQREELVSRRCKAQSEQMERLAKQCGELTSCMAEVQLIQTQLQRLADQRDAIGMHIQDLNLRLASDDRFRVEVMQSATQPIPGGFPRLRYAVPAGALCFAFLWVRRRARSRSAG